jgi:hypothetical protein
MQNQDDTKKTTHMNQDLARPLSLHNLCAGDAIAGECVTESEGATEVHQRKAVTAGMRQTGKRDRKLEMNLAQTIKRFDCPAILSVLEAAEAGLRL